MVTMWTHLWLIDSSNGGQGSRIDFFKSFGKYIGYLLKMPWHSSIFWLTNWPGSEPGPRWNLFALNSCLSSRFLITSGWWLQVRDHHCFCIMTGGVHYILCPSCLEEVIFSMWFWMTFLVIRWNFYHITYNSDFMGFELGMGHNIRNSDV